MQATSSPCVPTNTGGGGVDGGAGGNHTPDKSSKQTTIHYIMLIHSTKDRSKLLLPTLDIQFDSMAKSFLQRGIHGYCIGSRGCFVYDSERYQ